MDRKDHFRVSKRDLETALKVIAIHYKHQIIMSGALFFKEFNFFLDKWVDTHYNSFIFQKWVNTHLGGFKWKNCYI